jgi:hypothetical protein
METRFPGAAGLFLPGNEDFQTRREPTILQVIKQIMNREQPCLTPQPGDADLQGSA